MRSIGSLLAVAFVLVIGADAAAAGGKLFTIADLSQSVPNGTSDAEPIDVSTYKQISFMGAVIDGTPPFTISIAFNPDGKKYGDLGPKLLVGTCTIGLSSISDCPPFSVSGPFLAVRLQGPGGSGHSSIVLKVWASK